MVKVNPTSLLCDTIIPMELTNFEKRILSPKSQGKNKILLGFGIFFILLSIAAIFLTHHVATKVHNSFYNSYSLMQKNISPKTALETKLKGSLLEETEAASEGWTRCAEIQGLNLFQTSFFIGLLFITTHFAKKRYISLIKKLDSRPTTHSS